MAKKKKKTRQEDHHGPQPCEPDEADGHVALPDYMTDPSVSLDRISRLVLRDLERLDAAGAMALFIAFAARFVPESQRLMKSEDRGVAYQGVRMLPRFMMARLLVVAKVRRQGLAKLRAQRSVPPAV